MSTERVMRNDLVAAVAVQVPGSSAYAVELTFSELAIRMMGYYCAPLTITDAQFDWCQVWRRPVDLVTDFPVAVVADNVAYGSFSYRDLALQGGTSVTVTAVTDLTQAEAQAIVSALSN